jgi:hypothetical protein
MLTVLTISIPSVSYTKVSSSRLDLDLSVAKSTMEFFFTTTLPCREDGCRTVAKRRKKQKKKKKEKRTNTKVSVKSNADRRAGRAYRPLKRLGQEAFILSLIWGRRARERCWIRAMVPVATPKAEAFSPYPGPAF